MYAVSHQSLHSSSSIDSPMTQSGIYAIDMSGRQLISHQVIYAIIVRLPLSTVSVFPKDIYIPSILVHSQVTIIFVVSVCLSVCLCRVFLSRLRSDLDQTGTYVTCPGLIVSPRT